MYPGSFQISSRLGGHFVLGGLTREQVPLIKGKVTDRGSDI